MTISSGCGVIPRSMTSRSPSKIPAPRMDSPAARTKKVAAGRRTRCSFRSSLPSMWSSAGLGKPASTGEPNNGSSSGVGCSTKRSTFQVPEQKEHIKNIVAVIRQRMRSARAVNPQQGWRCPRPRPFSRLPASEYAWPPPCGVRQSGRAPPRSEKHPARQGRIRPATR